MDFLFRRVIDALAFSPIGAFAGWRFRDFDRAIIDPWWTAGPIVSERMLEILRVVALFESIYALVGPARFAPVQCRMHNRLRHLELVGELNRREPFGVPDA